MKISEALRILNGAPRDVSPFNVTLVCGFTPLHVQTFLGAHLQSLLPDRRVTVATGLYGDLAGSLERLKDSPAHAVAVVLEWADLDPRLGFRSAGKWGPSALAEIPSTARDSLERIGAAIEKIPSATPVACSLPTLPLPPAFHTPGWQTSQAELLLQQTASEFAVRVAHRRTLSLVNAFRLAEDSPAKDRLDLKSDLAAGLPYSIPHASALASALARLLAPPAPKKGLITDLDNTLWNGIVGEVGPGNVSWDLASHHQLHGLYQRLLAALAEEGVLIGIASKNDPAVVHEALQRNDLLLAPDRVFPVEAHWNAKSGSVGRILQTWNISADSVVFVDDSPLELAEVADSHPGIEGLLFPAGDDAAGYALLRKLRDLFGKQRLSEEDSIRLDTIRKRAVFQRDAAGASTPESFLRQVDATITFEICPASQDPRLLELVNKTNQFNLNGIRYTEADWHRRIAAAGAFVAAVSYQDKFGPLGKIAVVQGRLVQEALYIDTWVMSCRAFSRRIEHRCLKTLLDRSGVREVHFAFAPTPKNGPLQDFFASFSDCRPGAPFTLGRAQFEQHCPPLYHRVVESQTSSNPWMMQSQPV